MHPPRDAEGVAVGQSEQSALIVFAEGREDLVLRVALNATGPLTGLAWVIPVPAVPDKYAVADATLFDDVDALAGLVRVVNPPQSKSAKRSASPSSAKGEGLVALPVATAGPYEIHPLQAFGDEGSRQLNAWMTENGFGQLAADELEYYSRRGWTFLAVKIAPPGDSELNNGRLPPLHLSFASERIVYPLKLSANQGEFELRLYFVTPSAPAGIDEAVDVFNFVRVKHAPELAAGRKLPERKYPDGAIVKATEEFTSASTGPALKAVLQGTRIGPKAHLEVMHSVINSWATNVTKWREDFSIPPTRPDQELLGSAGPTMPSAPGQAEPAPEAPVPTSTATQPPPPTAPPVAESAAPKPKSGCSVAAGTASPDPCPLLVGLLLVGSRRRRTPV